ncbi:hypothetical protein [Microbispora sp. H11081]|uniref:hypothetical protein n=1 Tax=Microbispora sp. H11081 TaxID=2729107 RepID=UPI00147673B0|nr:hypothetical protein [Microbispora sp. H11081]
MRAKRFPSLLGLAFLAAVGLVAAQPAHNASAAATGWDGDGCSFSGYYQGHQWQYQSMGYSSLGTGPDAYPTAIIDID